MTRTSTECSNVSARTCYLWRTLALALFIVAIQCSIANAQTEPEGEDGDGPAALSSQYFGYLQKYGYAQANGPDAGTLRTQEEYSRGLRAFQSMYGLRETGTLSAETKELLDKPRCGIPDVQPRGGPGQIRARRYAHSGLKWGKKDLTYRFLSYTNDMSQSDQVHAIKKAFQVWSDITPLTFTERYTGAADIYLKFAIFDHGDGYPFDGEGGTLAHAFFPDPYLRGLEGDAHFDDYESFTVNTDAGIDLFIVAAHEFGHSLGLGHSTDLSALMAPFYSGYKADFRLPYDDQLGIQLLYGAKPYDPNENEPEEKPPVVTLPPPKPGDDRCSKVYDAISSIRGEIFLFKGSNVWRMRVLGQPMENYPIKISSFFKDLPKNIDASYERFDSTIMFFKGAEYWEYDNLEAREGFPKPISELGLPDDIDAALPWGYTGKTYFFKGKKYWRYDEYEKKVDADYPKLIREGWKGVPGNLFAAFRHYDGYSYSTYFLKYRRYWRYDENRGSVDEGYPRIFDVDWMGCAVGDLELEGSDGDIQEYFPFKTTTDDGTNSATNLRINIFMASCLLILLSLFQR
ncbi:putative 72 kDa type IV collagenase [Apostichopus japonicus]|uniref:Putative 72 kDa type IV collagenase n=1 Tax=Stichopus japonicus TaxID=307972 RepID=A0A2G8LFA8_STIJA|nr:putative 72 kDa type IV collagenase [Apostichopus japonicus]